MLRRLVLVLIFGAFAMLVGVTTASGHSQLVSSDPADGSVLSAPPTQLVLTFNEELLKEAVDVAIANGAGDVVSGDVATVVGAIARTRVLGKLSCSRMRNIWTLRCTMACWARSGVHSRGRCSTCSHSAQAYARAVARMATRMERTTSGAAWVVL